MKTKTLVAALLFISPALHAAENAYDVLGQVLSSFVDVFAEHPKGDNRAITMTLHLDEMAGLPKGAVAQASLWVEAPEKIKLHVPVLGQDVTICRNGQELWVSPGTPVTALLEKLNAEHRIPPSDPKFRLAPLKIPLPESQLVFLPALFQVDDHGFEDVNGKECRRLGLEIASPIARSLGTQGWSGEIFVTPEGAPARLVVTQKKGWSGSILFDSLAFSKTLPPETWQPTAAEAVDARAITPAEYAQVLSSIFAKKKKGK